MYSHDSPAGLWFKRKDTYTLTADAQTVEALADEGFGRLLSVFSEQGQSRTLEEIKTLLDGRCAAGNSMSCAVGECWPTAATLPGARRTKPSVCTGWLWMPGKRWRVKAADVAARYGRM